MRHELKQTKKHWNVSFLNEIPEIKLQSPKNTQPINIPTNTPALSSSLFTQGIIQQPQIGEKHVEIRHENMQGAMQAVLFSVECIMGWMVMHGGAW